MQKENEHEITTLKMTITSWTASIDGVVYFFIQCPICGSANGIPLSDVVKIVKQATKKAKQSTKKNKKTVYIA